MPYTKQVDRLKFEQVILSSIENIIRGSEPAHVKAEFFGFWVRRTVLSYVKHPQLENGALHSWTLNADKKNKLKALGDKAASLIATAGDLNYVISCVYWGILGDAKDVDSANYEFRTHTKGCIRKVIDTLSTSFREGTDKESVMIARKTLISESVLDDVILECYRQKTADYEDLKIQENSTLWKDGKLILSN